MSAVVLNGGGGATLRGSALYAVTWARSDWAPATAASASPALMKRPFACATGSFCPSCSRIALTSQYGTGTKARRSSSRSTIRRSVGVCTRPTERYSEP